jgi:hypothetical protein
MPSLGVVVYGQLDCEEVEEACKAYMKGKTITISKKTLSGKEIIDLKNDSIVIAPLSSLGDVEDLENKLQACEKDLEESEMANQKAAASIQTFQKQQQALFDEFVLLRQRYDEQKASLSSILWNQCCNYHPDLRQIPKVEDALTFVETEERIGSISVGDFLGEGQFATVKNCTMDGSEIEYAIKIIKKERISSFQSIQRVSNEIESLKQLKSPFVVNIAKVIHTQNMLYIITEKGGFDLFEFFDEHPDGVPEKWAKKIIGNILKGVLYCHEQGICHRGETIYFILFYFILFYFILFYFILFYLLINYFFYFLFFHRFETREYFTNL